MNIKTFHNSRGETASTDGKCWWSGADSDEATIAINALQPISALFPAQDGLQVVQGVVQKARAVFISALRKAEPNVTPADDMERAILRQAWDDAMAFAESHTIHAAGVPVFDCKMLVVGTADAVVKSDDGTLYTYCYFPANAQWRGETNALVRLLFRGFPIDAADDSHGFYTLAELARGVTALAYRHETEWYAERQRNMPF